MARTFFDTSALLKRYHTEDGSHAVDAILAQSGSEHYIARITVAEVHSALGRKVLKREISETAFASVIAQFLADVHQGDFKVIAATESQHLEAERLLARYAPTLGLRTLDSMQIAAAIALRQFAPIDYIVTSDERMKAVLAQEGFAILDPATSP